MLCLLLGSAALGLLGVPSGSLPVQTCNFQDDSCTWTVNETEWLWRRTTGKHLTDSNERGPHQDHMTDVDGYFMLADAAGALTDTSTAALTSEIYGHQVKRCKTQGLSGRGRERVSSLLSVLVHEGR